MVLFTHDVKRPKGLLTKTVWKTLHVNSALIFWKETEFKEIWNVKYYFNSTGYIKFLIIKLSVGFNSFNFIKWKLIQSELSSRGNQFPTFNTEFKFAKIQKFPCPVEGGLGGGGGVLMETNFQKSTSNFLSPVLNWNFHFMGGGGGLVECMEFGVATWRAFGVNYQILTQNFATHSEWVRHKKRKFLKLHKLELNIKH